MSTSSNAQDRPSKTSTTESEELDYQQSGVAAETSTSGGTAANDTGTVNTTSSTGLNTTGSTDSERYCWVCFATDEDDRLAAWVKPCKCIGTTKWVHQKCLQRWVDEKQKGNPFRHVICPQCQTEYIIVFPSMGSFAGILEGIDNMCKKLSPFLAAGVVVGCTYWAAVTYGAVTVLQVAGHKEGLELMENADPLVLLIALPAIPVCLILGRLIRWDDMILRFIQNRGHTVRKYPLLSLILPLPDESTDTLPQSQSESSVSDAISATRTFCGALLLPTMSSIVGKLFFDSIQNNVHRTLIGGFTFILVKGMLKIYLKQRQYVRKKQRKILDYTESNLQLYGRPETEQNNQFLNNSSLNVIGNDIFF